MTAMLEAGVVDTSAIVAILEGEPSAEAFLAGFAQCRKLYLGAATLAELSIVVQTRRGKGALVMLDELLSAWGIEIVPADLRQIEIFREGYGQYGKGRHPAGLNFGDLFSYSLALAKGVPLYFQGLDFSRTDVANAMAELGYRFSAQGEPLAPERS